MRGGTAELGDHAGNARQHVAQRRAGDARDQHVTGRNPRQLALAVHHHRAAGAPADARRMSAETGMLAPDLVGHGDWLDGERARLQELEALMVERPFDLDWTAYDGFCFAHHAAKRHRLRGVKTRRADEFARHRLRHGAGAVAAAVAVMLAAGVDRAQKPLAREYDAVRDDLALRDGRAEPQVALMSIPPEAVSLKPPPEARASTRGWMSTAMPVSAGERAWFAMPRRAVVVHSAAQQARTAVSNAA